MKLASAIAAAVAEALMCGAAMHSFGLDAHGYAVFPLALGTGAFFLVRRAFP